MHGMCSEWSSVFGANVGTNQRICNIWIIFCLKKRVENLFVVWGAWMLLLMLLMRTHTSSRLMIYSTSIVSLTFCIHLYKAEFNKVTHSRVVAPNVRERLHSLAIAIANNTRASGQFVYLHFWKWLHRWCGGMAGNCSFCYAFIALHMCMPFYFFFTEIQKQNLFCRSVPVRWRCRGVARVAIRASNAMQQINSNLERNCADSIWFPYQIAIIFVLISGGWELHAAM